MAIITLYVFSQDDPEARSWLAFLKRHGFANLRGLTMERVIRLEGRFNLERLMPLLINPLFQQSSSASVLNPESGPVLEIGYRPAVTDPETPSILEGAHALGETGLEFARLARRFQFQGLSATEARMAAERFLFNKIVERIYEPGVVMVTLRPSGQPDPPTTVSLRGLSEVRMEELSRERSWYAPVSQMRVIQQHELAQGRDHTDAEIEILVQTWSDHCYHTTWKSLGLLKRLSAATARIAHPLVVSSFKDNAGGMEFYRGWVITIKGETHNFPSSIAPFGGVATKHGGVIRDTLGFGKGAYPIGGSTLMGTMDPRMDDAAVPAGALHPQLIVTESIRATAYYNNPMGIPMLHPVYRIHPGYAKCLALGHSIGLIPARDAIKDDPRPNDLVLLLGGATGRDGIHGATASSTRMTADTLVKESAAVQIGHPITERRFATAIPALRDAGLVRSITDLGAGGISCAAGEMGAETGVLLNLDAVPLKDQSLTAWEILLSESQERMLIAIAPENLEEVQALLRRYEVDYAVIGRFTDSHRLQAEWRGQRVADLEMEFLWGACPLDQIPVRAPLRGLQPLCLQQPESPEAWRRAMHEVLAHYHCCDQSLAAVRFDTTVQGRTVIAPLGGRNQRMPNGFSVLAPLHDGFEGVVTTVALNPFYGDVDPPGMARLMMVEAITKAVAAGASRCEMVLCDNFYTPRVRPEVAWDLTAMVDTIADLSVALGVPFISGKDSSSGSMEAGGKMVDVPPTLAVAAMARVPDVRRIRTKEFKRAGNSLAVAGLLGPHALGGSVYADAQGQRGDALFSPGKPEQLLAFWDELLSLVQAPHCVSACAIGEGGLALRLFEGGLGSGLGARVDLSCMAGLLVSSAADTPSNSNLRAITPLELMFGEFNGAVLLELTPQGGAQAQKAGFPCVVIGEVLSDAQLIVLNGKQQCFAESLSDLEQVWSATFREVLE